MNQQLVEAYEENIRGARARLAHVQERFGRLKDAGLIFWGKRTLKSGSEYEGWLVKGEEADAAFTDRAHAGSDLMHWLRLLAEEKSEPEPKATRAPVAVTEDEKRAFVEEWKKTLEARGVDTSTVAPAPPAEPDVRLPPEKDDEIDF